MAKTFAKGSGWSILSKGDHILLKLKKTTPELNRQLRFAVRDIAYDIPAEVIKHMGDFKPGKRGRSSPLMVRSGKLAQTVEGRPIGSTADNLRAKIWAGSSTVPYARVHEFGTVGAGGTLPDIKPKKKFLRMPLPHILTAAGNVKGKYEIVERAGSYMTADGNPTWISGRAIMIEENGKFKPIWALMTESKIPPRLGIGKTIEEKGEWIRDRLLEAIDRAVPK